jgi:hypothetical protein
LRHINAGQAELQSQGRWVLDQCLFKDSTCFLIPPKAHQGGRPVLGHLLGKTPFYIGILKMRDGLLQMLFLEGNSPQPFLGHANQGKRMKSLFCLEPGLLQIPLLESFPNTLLWSLLSAQ